MDQEHWERLFKAWEQMGMEADHTDEVIEWLQEDDELHELQYAISHFSSYIYHEIESLHRYVHLSHSAPTIHPYCDFHA